MQRRRKGPTSSSTFSSKGSEPCPPSHPDPNTFLSNLRWILVSAVKLVLLVLLVAPVFHLLDWLNDTQVSFYVSAWSWFLLSAWTCSLALHYRNRPKPLSKDHTFLVAAALSLAFSLAFVLYYCGVFSQLIFIIFTGWAGVCICEAILLLSVLVGQHRYTFLQRIFFSVGFFSPVLGGMGSLLLTKNQELYRLGILASMSCSWANLLFNKSSSSVGAVPKILRVSSLNDISSFSPFD